MGRGRPKKSDLQCTVCNKTFLKKHNLEEHMECHSAIDIVTKHRQTRANSNWCYICRKSFEDSEYKLHIQKEHLHNSHNQSASSSGSDEDLFSCENGYVLLSKKRIKREVDSRSSVDSEGPARMEVSNIQNEISIANIKVEPTETSDEEIYNTTPKPRISFIKCSICSMRCKGKKGLLIHTGMAHRHNPSSNASQDNNLSELEKQDQQPRQSNINVMQENNSNPIILDSSTRSGLLSGVLPLNNALTIGNQISPIPGNENAKILEVIPKFDCNSESYIKWLKKFIFKCKTHKYPLPPVMCENINHVLEEMSYAVGNPVGSLRKKSNHFYFMRMHKILSEIIMGHMRHSLSIVIR